MALNEVIRMKLVTKRLAQHRNWLSKTGNRVATRDSDYLLNDLAECSVRSLRRLPNSLSSLAIYHGVRGLLMIDDGDPDGWQQLGTSIDFHAWSNVFRFEPFLRGHATLGIANHMMLLSCVACVSCNWQHRMLGILKQMKSETEFQLQHNRRPKHLEDLVLWAASWESDGPTNNALSQTSPYAMFLNESINRQHVVNIALPLYEYHLSQVEDNTNDEYSAEFKHAPFDRNRSRVGEPVKHGVFNALENADSRFAQFWYAKADEPSKQNVQVPLNTGILVLRQTAKLYKPDL